MSEGIFDLSRATIPNINLAFDKGTLTSEQLVQLYLNRITDYDKQGPKINAVISLNPDCIPLAQKLDTERKAQGPRSLMHGIPVVVKDIIDKEGMPTTGGCDKLKSSYPSRDAEVIRNLARAGAIVLAKVNTNDWFIQSPMSCSTLGGQTRNPHNLNYTAGGSSCGTGAALAANFAPVGIGTDTSGSVLMPSAHCGLFGMIPSSGLISRAGVMPLGLTLDRIGVMARSAFDMAALLSSVIGWDPEDLTTNEALDLFPQQQYETDLAVRSIGSFRIGVLREMWLEGPTYTEGTEIIEQFLEILRQAGAVLVDPVMTGINFETGSMQSKQSCAFAYEVLRSLDAYFARLGPEAPYSSTKQLINAIGLESLKGHFQEATSLPPPEKSGYYQARRKSQSMLREIIVKSIQQFQLDAVMLPYSLDGPSPIGATAAPFNSLASHAGLPSVVVPAGQTADSLPIAAQFIAEPYHDKKLLQIAHLLEQLGTVCQLPVSTPALSEEDL